MSTTAIARDIAQIKYDLAELKAITHVTWLRTRPQMEWYFALPVALMAYFMVLSPLRTAGTPVSEAVDTAFEAVNTAAERAGAWLASIIPVVNENSVKLHYPPIR